MNKHDKANLGFIIIALVIIAVVTVMSVITTRDANNASVPKKLSSPVRNPEALNLNMDAESAISLWISGNGDQEKVLFEKNADEKLLIASLTKLMTADIVLENYDLSEDATISKRAVTEGGYFKEGEVFPVKTLLYTMLIGSDNIAAYALSEKIGTDKFAALMNQKAKDLGLSNTYYSNSVGFGLKNHSTANDLTELIKWILKNQPSIFNISITPEFNVYDLNGNLRYKVKNTDVLLTDPSISWANRIVGNKTANNEDAGECLVLIVKSPNSNGYLINIILKSKDRFGEMKNLVNWAYASYNWNF
jgi:D-alanyl-D-alanine carboxypeptidase